MAPSDDTFSRATRPPTLRPLPIGAERTTASQQWSPTALEARARAVLAEHVAPDATDVQSAVAHAAVAVHADHTHYSDGYALLLALDAAVAVALAPAAQGAPQICADGDGGPQVMEGAQEDLPLWARAAHAAVQALAPMPMHIAIASTVPPPCGDGYAAAAAVSAARALGGTDTDEAPHPPADQLPRLATALAEGTGRPVGLAHLLASRADRPGDFVLVDTATREHLPVETEAHAALTWGLVDPEAAPLPPQVHRDRREAAEEALRRLRAGSFDNLTAFRDLEHRDLQAAKSTVPDALQPLVHHLVTENRRVQSHVAALRRGDWQMAGALLLMAHDSRRTRWGDTPPAADRAVSVVEGLTLDGLYGACMTERDGAVLVVGRKPAFQDALRRVAQTFTAEHDRPLRVLPL